MKLLIVDNDRVTRDLVREILEVEGYDLSLASSGEEALQRLAQEEFAIVVTDIRMLDVDGVALLKTIRGSGRKTVVILMTGFGTMEGAIQAIQEGAFDYLSKPFQIEELRSVVARAAKHWQATQGNKQESELKPETVRPRTLIGKSPQIIEVYKTLARATLSPSNVLIVGESGTGKELVARAIHQNSGWKNKPFVAINCAALTDTLLESELFGHVRGAFTGAVGNKPGLFEMADGGTIFLDEVGNLSPALQVKLLRVLQEGEYKPVGSNETRRVDVRIVAATNANLEEAITKGIFREDLYYRLKVILIQLPPLRNRKEDLPELVSFFLGVYSKKIGKQVFRVSEEAMALLMAYSWPGNIRELEHAIERAVTMTPSSVLYPEDFSFEVNSIVEADGIGSSLENIERDHIVRVLDSVQWNKSRAASLLGIDRKTLHRKAQRYGITLKSR